MEHFGLGIITLNGVIFAAPSDQPAAISRSVEALAATIGGSSFFSWDSWPALPSDDIGWQFPVSGFPSRFSAES